MKANVKFSDFWASLEPKRRIRKGKMYAVLAAVTAISIFVAVYFGLVPVSLYHSGFRFFLVYLLLLWSVPPLFFVDVKKNGNPPLKKNPWTIPLLLAALFTVVNLLFSLVTSPLFMAHKYRDLIFVHDNESFVESVEDYSTMQIPVVDRGLAEKLGDKKLGEDNLGSQYNVGSYYMICHENNLYWIAPIEFNGFFPWTNRKTSPGYVMVNANDQSDVKIVKAELHYTESSYLWDDLNRQNYFNNMTAWRADEPHLELTDEGEPRFVETVYVNRIGYTNGTDVAGIIVTNPITGESEYFDYLDAPTWINHVMTEEIILQQLQGWGAYVDGFFNSLFAKKDVLEVSTGINYVYSNGNMYLQTGMTSVGSDESIVGVMMVDMRTKEAKFCRIGGATEYAAAQSAIGKDQEKRYSASDPIMINLDGEPTYFLMLKDDEGLVKRYAYVNVNDYRLVATADTQTSALIEYKKMIQKEDASPAQEVVISDVVQVTVNGNTMYYLRFESTGTQVFVAPLSIDPSLPFAQKGDTLKIRYEQNGDVFEISSIERA